MEKVKEKVALAKEWAGRPRNKKRLYVVFVALMVGRVLFRFAVIGAQHRLQVYNPARAAAAGGTPVAVMEMRRAPGVVREPLTVKNNRAYVSGARVGLLRAGMRVGDGEIVSVGAGIDLDTGMHVVRTRGVADGLQFAEFNANGYFVPVYAIEDGAVYLMRDGVAVRTPVQVTRRDIDTAYVSAGLNDGDVVILSRVDDGAKVVVKK